MKPIELMALLMFAGCGGAAVNRDEGMGVVDGVETSAAGLEAFVKERRYAGWTSDPQIRSNLFNSPHAKVRVFFNDKLRDSLRADAGTHPVGAMAVKELYDDSGKVYGHTAAIKVSAQSHIWLEKTPDLDFYGKDLRVCVSCHSQGRDAVVSPLP